MAPSVSHSKYIQITSAAMPKQGDGGIYPPNNWTPSLNKYKIHTPNIFNLPNLLNGDHLVLKT